MCFLPVQYIFDVLDEAKEDFSRKETKNKYDVIKEAIPQDWIKRIENMEDEKQGNEIYMKLGEKMLVFKECSVKIFYCILRDGIFKNPTVNGYWLKSGIFH